MKKLLAILLFLSSCSHSTLLINHKDQEMSVCEFPLLVTVSEDFSKEIQFSIEEGFNYWNQVLGYQVFVYVGTTWWTQFDDETLDLIEDIPIEKIISVTGEVSENNTRCAVTELPPKQCISVGNVKINLDCIDRLDKRRLLTLIRHEAGHALGLSHSDFQIDLMYSTISRGNWHPKDASKQTIDMLKELYCN